MGRLITQMGGKGVTPEGDRLAVALLLCFSVSLLLCCSVALLLCCSVVLLFCCSVALFFCCAVALLPRCSLYRQKDCWIALPTLVFVCMTRSADLCLILYSVLVRPREAVVEGQVFLRFLCICGQSMNLYVYSIGSLL